MKLIITDLAHFRNTVSGEHQLIAPKDSVRHCIGCFGCWAKTPGICVIHDGYEKTSIAMGKCIELIYISKCCYGGFSPSVKAIQDRAISYVHPDFVMLDGEMHHKRRYANQISLSAHFYGENISDAEKETARNILQANADNFDGVVKTICFYKTIQELEEVVL
ncbi:flavodoxin family protein [uncultured Ruminococcus sp.]|uniref:flavodoxin family protein n=1 Tax=uncultured Ruminococcus sp. TaxID=165186 RepID=UPI00260F8D07|nr:flavodoxin family protein [uncultured Ruminococcus sp.]